LLYIHDKSNRKNLLFHNKSEFLRLNYVIKAINQIIFYNNYLAIVTIVNTKEHPAYAFILIHVIPKSGNEDRLVEVFQTNLNEIPSLSHVDRIIFNQSKLLRIIFNQSKLLLLFDSKPNFFFMTFNIKTLQFSDLLKLGRDNHFCYNVFYCYSNILQDIIIYVDGTSGIVYTVKESNENCLYVYRAISLAIPGNYLITNISLCNNRNNEIILFIKIFELGGVASEIIFYYDVLNGETCKKDLDNPIGFGSSIFFNPTGEEIFIVNNHQLIMDVYVYKSKVRSLKRTCQILVLEQYSSEQLNLMNLPKNLLHIE